MLIQLTIENFYSIKEKMEIDMRVPSKTPADSRFTIIDDEDDLRLKKVLCLVGANATGKTTILRALGFLRMFVTSSFEVCRAEEGVPTSSFDDQYGEKNKTTIEVEFAVPRERRQRWARYKYSLAILNVAYGKSYVERETLEGAEPNGKYVRIFDRIMGDDGYLVKSHSAFELKRDDPRSKARSNVSLISNLLQFEHNPSREFSSIFSLMFLSNVAVNKNNFDESVATNYLKSNEDVRKEFTKVMRKIDLGISGFEILEVDGEDLPVFTHDGRENSNSLFFESQGTKNFYCLYPIISYCRVVGACAAIDELDSDLHPNLVYEIIRWFQDSSESHRYSQIITTLNHPSVLAYLEKEEVGIVEKDHRGYTSYVPLSDFEGVRRDTNLYKKYMGGHFGGLPMFG